MKKHYTRIFALLMVAAMLLGMMAGCKSEDTGSSTGPVETNGTESTPTEPQVEYPVTPEELGSGTAKWTEETTVDGWVQVTNDGGETLGYSPDSGVKLIQVDGYAFKDLNRNGLLDAYEDWRLDDNTRAADLASQLSSEEIFGLMVHGSTFDVFEDESKRELTADYTEMLDKGIRCIIQFSDTFPAATMVNWNNTIQEYAESSSHGVPVNTSANPRSFSGEGESLALAATFDPELVWATYNNLAKQLRSIGVTTFLGPEIDLGTDPRWKRYGTTDGTFGEDPALVADIVNAATSALQSTYDENGNDLGWGNESVNAVLKHFPGDGAGESGREAHEAYGAYTVYPGNGFETALIPFISGGMNLDSSTGEMSSVMLSYSIAYSTDGSYGELVPSAFSEYKINLLRETYNFDGLILTDWDVIDGERGAWGLQDLSEAERAYMAICAGVDQFGGETTTANLSAAYDMLVEEQGEEATRARFEDSARRVLRTFFQVGLFENPYCDVATAVALIEGEDVQAFGYETQQRSVVMLKNANNTIQAATSDEKPTVYIPMQFNNKSGWSLPVDLKTAEQYFNVVTDTAGEPSGEPGPMGNPSYTTDDIIRASAAELADCSMALVLINNPDTGDGYDKATGTYIPISLQYGEYTAKSSGVRSESIAGDQIIGSVESPYGEITTSTQENRAYYGQSTVATNLTDLEGIQYAVANMPEGASIIVAVTADNPMIFAEFESDVDAILVGFGSGSVGTAGFNTSVFIEVAAGVLEPTGLLPCQMPANMETVEAQFEDVPRDMECYVDSEGNIYDFAFGLNWSGVIQDARTEKYAVPVVTELAD